MNFKRVIGQDHSEPRTAKELPEISRQPEVAPHATSPAASAPRPVAVASRNILSSDVEIKGTVKFTNDLVIDGKIEGEITSDGNLTVGENARIKAEIKTSTVVVYGKVHGNLTASNRIDLKASAEVIGDIKAQTLSIEAGAIFVGKSTVGTPAAAAANPASPSPVSSTKSPAAPAPQTAAAKPQDPNARETQPKQASLLPGEKS
ncbi:MAG: bactofilin family protein [Luteolibacter sp.]